jgi:ferrous iron transport protein A
MSDHKQIPLNRMESGQRGKVIEIQGGQGIVRRLEALGVRTGRNITKVSSMFMRGPVTLQIGNMQIAIGFGMARRIIVELD